MGKGKVRAKIQIRVPHGSVQFCEKMRRRLGINKRRLLRPFFQKEFFKIRNKKKSKQNFQNVILKKK